MAVSDWLFKQAKLDKVPDSFERVEYLRSTRRIMGVSQSYNEFVWSLSKKLSDPLHFFVKDFATVDKTKPLLKILDAVQTYSKDNEIKMYVGVRVVRSSLDIPEEDYISYGQQSLKATEKKFNMDVQRYGQTASQARGIITSLLIDKEYHKQILESQDYRHTFLTS